MADENDGSHLEYTNVAIQEDCKKSLTSAHLKEPFAQAFTPEVPASAPASAPAEPPTSSEPEE